MSDQLTRYSELEAKLRVIESRSTQTSKDLQELYNELTEVKGQKVEIEAKRQAVALENQSLLSTLKKKQSDIEARDTEIQQY